jgi:radical SAM superfamily enzyme YgiQ (UPF0313 family)
VKQGCTNVFIGIESPHEASLAERDKVQNTKRNLVAAVQTIRYAGLQVMAGFIVGIANDPEGIVGQQRRFTCEAGVTGGQTA